MQKHIIKRQEQAQEPDSDTAGTLELSGWEFKIIKIDMLR